MSDDWHVGEDGGPSRPESGRARVRRVLIAPLEAKGMRRKRRTSEAAHAEDMRRLAMELDHLTEHELALLRIAVERLAGGRARDVWPSELVVLNVARGIRERRLEDCHLTTTWMRSAAGRDAWGEGPHVAAELLAFFARRERRRVPPTAYSMREIRERAAEGLAAVEAARRRVAGGEAREGDADLVAAHERRVERARRFVFPDAEGLDDAA